MPPAPPREAAALIVHSLEGVDALHTWHGVASALGADAVERILEGGNLPPWTRALATADNAFWREAERSPVSPPVDPILAQYDLPGLRAYRSPTGHIGWLAPLGRVAANDANATAMLVRALPDVPRDTIAVVIVASLLPGYEVYADVITSEVRRMDGWSAGPVVGVEYALHVRRPDGTDAEVRFVVTEEGGELTL